MKNSLLGMKVNKRLCSKKKLVWNSKIFSWINKFKMLNRAGLLMKRIIKLNWKLLRKITNNRFNNKNSNMKLKLLIWLIVTTIVISSYLANHCYLKANFVLFQHMLAQHHQPQQIKMTRFWSTNNDYFIFDILGKGSCNPWAYKTSPPEYYNFHF